jgi:hypothetical protein
MGYESLQQTVDAILCAACIVRPRDPGLTWEELRTIALESGVGAGEYDDDIQAVVGGSHVRVHDDDGRLVAGTSAWGVLREGLFAAPEEVRPMRALGALADAFDALDKSHGRDHPKAEDVLFNRLRDVPKEKFDVAIGLLTAWGALVRSDGGLVRKGNWARKAHMTEDQDPLASRMLKVRPLVERAFARRGVQPAPSAPPLERFAALARKQGWDGFASWWVLTHAEFRDLSDAHAPTSVCVLAGALLEAALIAIAPAAIAADQWKRSFLKDKPTDRWNLGELIEQAAVAQVFTAADANLAKDLANLRNRIHAGKFAPAGQIGPLSPQYANAHEAQLARTHLDRLIDRILVWPTVVALPAP